MCNVHMHVIPITTFLIYLLYTSTIYAILTICADCEWISFVLGIVF